MDQDHQHGDKFNPTVFSTDQSKTHDQKLERKNRKVNGFELMMRVLGVVLTLVAAIILGVNKQTKLVSLELLPNLPPVYVPATAKAHYLSAFVYCTVINAMACAYGVVSMVLLTRKKVRKSGVMMMMITVIDLVMVALLFSSNGAAAAIGLMGYEGNSRLRWNKVCNVFGKFCVQVAVAIVLSLLACVVFLCLVLFALFTIYKISK
ncbi:CASP-like protein 1E2 [Carica papaya]|uniref:CASP-like protein 1E2 n=1 Tax=Carica papaya TaxID=3649 RepID=UPI000B8CABDC|nr:CASP-like protein 1E2 [Carica papaya]